INCDVVPSRVVHVGADHGIYKNMVLLPLSENESNPMEKRSAALVEVVSEKGSLGTFLVPSRTPEQEQQTFKAANHEWALSLAFAPMAGGNTLVLSEAGGFRDTRVMFPESEFSANAELKHKG